MAIDYTKRQWQSFMWLSLSIIGGIFLYMLMHNFGLYLIGIAFAIVCAALAVFFLIRFIQTTSVKSKQSKIRRV